MANNPQNEPITVRIDSLATGGSCAGTITAPEALCGKKAFIRGAIPGELVGAEVTYSKKNFVEAKAVSILNSSPERVEPPCTLFGECGGCDLQHINLPAQRRLKQSMVEDLLRIHGGVEANEGVSLLGEQLPGLNYRRRMSFHINKKAEFGLYRKNGRSIVELSSCPISTDTINRVLSEALHLIKGCAPEIETVTIEDHDGEPFLALEVHPRNEKAMDTLGSKQAFQDLCSQYPNTRVNYRHKPIFCATPIEEDSPPVGHFSQNNKLANDAMIEYLISSVHTDAVTDMYAGAGNISIPLALAGKIVTAVEVNPHLVKFGITRAADAGVANSLIFHEQSCEKWIERNDAGRTVVLDPPRGGALEVCKRLDPTVSDTVIYVSCYPPTFARDVQILEERGYQLQSVKVLDMFPQTYHAELIGILTARNS
jgi:23S rRNA (uracil1939-C5)-methyltransferase